MAHSHSSRRRSNLRRQALVTAAACLAVLAVVCLACWALVRKPKQEDSTPVAGTDLSAAGDGSGLIYDALVIGLCRERSALYDRINRRVEHMFADGLEREVAWLMASGVTPDMPAMRGIGYRETAQVVQGQMEREAAIASIQQSTRHFAKRQLTWYRRMPYIEWLDAAQPPEQLLQAAMGLVRTFTSSTNPLER